MAEAFPEELVKKIYDSISDHKKAHPELYKKNSYIANSFAKSLFEYIYRFEDNLKTGIYAPYMHEKFNNDICGSNCTTIIPEAYLNFRALGTKPQIVQFIGLRDIKTKSDRDDPQDGSHFSIIVDIGKKHKYLLDVFYHIFGPIIKEGKNYFKIGEYEGRKARKREFKDILYYTEQEFAEMIESLKDPGKSLDMLVAGQKVFANKTINKDDCTMHVYYHDDANTITTRLRIPQASISDKFIFCNQEFDSFGDLRKTSLELIIANKHGWDSLAGDKKVATTDFIELRKTYRIINKLTNQSNGKKINLRNYDRIGQSIINDNASKIKLFKIADELYSRLTDCQKEKIEPMILSRTLYEFEKPDLGYIYSKEEHDARLIDLVAKDRKLISDRFSRDYMSYLAGWKLKKFDRNELIRNERQLQKIKEQKTELVAEIDSLNNLRRDNKKAYYRTMDKVLFSKGISGANQKELEEMVNNNGLDKRIGYIAMVSDFIPFALDARDNLTLKLYIDNIRQKIKARKSKTA